MIDEATAADRTARYAGHVSRDGQAAPLAIGMKRRLLYLVLVSVALAVWVVGLGGWPFVQWSALNCSHEDIDINSGRIRRQHILLGLCISESVEETSLSALTEVDAVDKPPAWRRVNTFLPVTDYHPHCRYHGAISQIQTMEAMWRLASFTPEAKRRMTRDVLSLWQLDDGYFVVSEYLSKVEDMLAQKGDSDIVDQQDLSLIDVLEKRQHEHVR